MRLLRLDHEGVQKLIDGMEKDCEAIKKSAITLSWYLRGGASYTDILNMSIAEREHISELIERNMETTKKTQMPFF